MKVDLDKLPDDPDELKRVIGELQVQHQKALSKVEGLEEEVALLRQKLFGRKSEKPLEVDPEQGSLFDLPEADEADGEVDETESPEEEDDLVEIDSYKRRRKPGRKPLPSDLPREDIVHDIPEEEKHCACGAELTRIGEEVSERLRHIPARTVVERHVRPKYACRCCEGTEDEKPTVKIAPLPSRLLPKTIATPSLVAHILTSKFCDAVPFYRQEKQFARIGVEISRTTMCNWALKVGQAVDGLIEAEGDEVGVTERSEAEEDETGDQDDRAPVDGTVRLVGSHDARKNHHRRTGQQCDQRGDPRVRGGAEQQHRVELLPHGCEPFRQRLSRIGFQTIRDRLLDPAQRNALVERFAARSFPTEAGQDAMRALTSP